MKKATIIIKNLALRTILGINNWERKEKQDILINIAIDFDAEAAAASDNIDDTINYKSLKKKIIAEAENNGYFLVEKLVDRILDIIMTEPRAIRATVRVDKPFALRYAESVAIEMTRERE